MDDENENENDKDQEKQQYDSEVDKEAIEDLMETFEFFEKNNKENEKNNDDDDDDDDDEDTQLVSRITKRADVPNEQLVSSYKKMLDRPLPKSVDGSLFPGYGAGVFMKNTPKSMASDNNNMSFHRSSSQSMMKSGGKRGKRAPKDSTDQEEAVRPVHISLDEIATIMGKKSSGTYKIERYVNKREKRRKHKQRLKTRKKRRFSDDDDDDVSTDETNQTMEKRSTCSTTRHKRPKNHKRKKKIKKPGTMFSSTEYSSCSSDDENGGGGGSGERSSNTHNSKKKKHKKATTFEEDSFFMSDSNKENNSEGIGGGDGTDDDDDDDDDEEHCFSNISKRKNTKSRPSSNAWARDIMEKSMSTHSDKGRNSSSSCISTQEEEIILRGQGSHTSSEDGGQHIIREGYMRTITPINGDDEAFNNHHHHHHEHNDHYDMSIARRERIYGNDGDPRTCFLCQFGNVRYDSVISTDINTLWEMIYSNYFSVADTEGLASAAYAYYYENIYLKGIQNGDDLPMWSERGMYIHITEHMGDPRIFLGESIKSLSMMRRMLYNFCVVKDEEGTTKPDTKVCAEVRMITKQMLDLYKSDAQSMFGYCESFRADPSQMNRLIHLSRVKFKETAAIESSRGSFS